MMMTVWTNWTDKINCMIGSDGQRVSRETHKLVLSRTSGQLVLMSRVSYSLVFINAEDPQVKGQYTMAEIEAAIVAAQVGELADMQQGSYFSRAPWRKIYSEFNAWFIHHAAGVTFQKAWALLDKLRRNDAGAGMPPPFNETQWGGAPPVEMIPKWARHLYPNAQ